MKKKIKREKIENMKYIKINYTNKRRIKEARKGKQKQKKIKH